MGHGNGRRDSEQTAHLIFTFNALITVSMCVFTASCENSELASVHMLSSAR